MTPQFKLVYCTVGLFIITIIIIIIIVFIFIAEQNVTLTSSLYDLLSCFGDIHQCVCFGIKITDNLLLTLLLSCGVQSITPKQEGKRVFSSLRQTTKTL